MTTMSSGANHRMPAGEAGSPAVFHSARHGEKETAWPAASHLMNRAQAQGLAGDESRTRSGPIVLQADAR